MKTNFDNYIPEPNSGCWLWVGQQHRQGYGCLMINGKFKLAHRVMYERFVGPIPDGMMVLHKCDIPSCVNPDHLFVGTQTDNMHDMCAKGRHTPVAGERNSHAKLTVADVIAIRASKERNVDLAKKYGIKADSIWKVKSRRTWAHIQ